MKLIKQAFTTSFFKICHCIEIASFKVISKRVSFALFLSSTIISGCQKELDAEIPATTTTTTNTDTSVIFSKKTIYYRTGDSTITIYRNNKINGVKGYIISDSSLSTRYPSSTDVFTYNNSGNLIEIVSTENTPQPRIIATVKLTRDNNNRIQNINFDAEGSYGMDRNYYYEEVGDTLLTKYTQSIGRNAYLDSRSVEIASNLNQDKIYYIYKEGAFDYTNWFDNTKGDLFNKKSFTYTASDITSIKTNIETYYAVNSSGFLHELDSSVCYFTRQTQVNRFLTDIEKDILGTDLRLLSYDQTDTINSISDSYFNFGENYGADLDYLQTVNAFIGGSSPASSVNFNYVVYRDGVITSKKSEEVYKKYAYTLDSKNRISLCEEFDGSTGELITKNYYYYP